MIVAIHQLHYLPWLRYVHKMASCDAFVALDDIQFNKNGWQNRNKIKGPGGWQFLTVPVRHKMGQRLDEVKIDNTTPWARRHWQSLATCYGKAPFFRDYAAEFSTMYQKQLDNLNDLNFALLSGLARKMDLKAPLIRSSTLGIKTEATQRLVDICKALGAKAYLTGEFAAAQYLEPELFRQTGIDLLFQKYECPVYTQQFSRAGFIPDMSIVDLLFNHGPESLKILLGNCQVNDTALATHAR